MTRGRKRKYCNKQLAELILLYKDKIWKDGAVVKSSPIYERICRELNNTLKPNSVYSMITNNRDGLLDVVKEKTNSVDCSAISDNLNSTSGSSDSTGSDVLNKQSFFFDIEILKDEFESMTHIVEYPHSTREATERKRKYKKFRPGVWQPYFNKKIYNHTRLPCGFNYNNQHLTLTGNEGSFQGTYDFNIKFHL